MKIIQYYYDEKTEKIIDEIKKEFNLTNKTAAISKGLELAEDSMKK